jgi:riboflavin synthase alpha subunit
MFQDRLDSTSLEQVRRGSSVGHQGVCKTFDKVRQQYWQQATSNVGSGANNVIPVLAKVPEPRAGA